MISCKFKISYIDSEALGNLKVFKKQIYGHELLFSFCPIKMAHTYTDPPPTDPSFLYEVVHFHFSINSAVLKQLRNRIFEEFKAFQYIITVILLTASSTEDRLNFYLFWSCLWINTISGTCFFLFMLLFISPY